MRFRFFRFGLLSAAASFATILFEMMKLKKFVDVGSNRFAATIGKAATAVTNKSTDGPPVTPVSSSPAGPIIIGKNEEAAVEDVDLDTSTYTAAVTASAVSAANANATATADADEANITIIKLFGFGFGTKPTKYNKHYNKSSSKYNNTRFVRTLDPHGTNTWWVRNWQTDRNISNDVIETLRVRFRRRGWVYDDSSNNKDVMMLDDANNKELIRQQQRIYRIMEEDNFKVFYRDGSDANRISRTQQVLRNTITRYLGPKHVYLITRTTTSQPFRNMKKYYDLATNTTFRSEDLGGTYNFTNAVVGIGNNNNGKQQQQQQQQQQQLYAGVKHYTYPVREELHQKLIEEFRNRTTSLAAAVEDESIIIAQGGGGDQHRRDPVVYSYRPVDVATFWDPDDTTNYAYLRSAVSRAVKALSIQRNLTAITGVAGWRAHQGRNKVHPDYVNALLDIKIYVLCQRDRWEDHIRLFEAMVSGALVLTDPMLDLPTGLVDGETIIVYKSIADMQNKILYYLKNDGERLQVAQRGRKEALDNHRIWHRWENLLLGDWSVRDKYGISVID